MSDDDPRRFPRAADAPAEFARVYATVTAHLAATTRRDADARNSELRAMLAGLLFPGQGSALAGLFAGVPSVAVYRHLWRLLVECERAPRSDRDLALTLFALPIVIVAACEAGDEPKVVPAVLQDATALAAILSEHGALAGNRNFALANVLVAADALDFRSLPDLLAWRSLPDALPEGVAPPPRALSAAPIRVVGRQEGAHLRFLLGSALAAAGAEPLRDRSTARWGMPVAQALAAQLRRPGVSLLALPLALESPSSALASGRAAQREVAAQLFASSAIRKLRSAVGEPSAVISVHRVGEPAGGAEVRLSLSSPYDPREAEGFRCPLAPSDRLDDVVRLLTDLMHDCRVTDVRREPGVHADRDPATGLTLLFKADRSGPPALH